MAKKFQVVEKEAVGVDWSLVRYQSYALENFKTKEEAETAAIRYLTDLNCNNPLAAAEKQAASEAYMMRDDGCFLGILDGKEWYICYPKDVVGKSKTSGNVETLYKKGDKVTDTSYFELEGKTQVTVRQVPGT